MLKIFKELNNLPADSRVWVFPSTRTFLDKEVEQIQAQLDIFLFQWAAHGADLYASGHILFNRFIVVMLDEENVKASGCSIDSLTHFIKKIEVDYGTSLTDRININFLVKNKVTDVHLNDVSGNVTSDMLFFDQLVKTKNEFESDWLIPVKGSWLERYL